MNARPLQTSAALVMAANSFGGIIPPGPAIVQAAAQPAPGTMLSVIRPDARDRWSAACLRNVTPERVESILRGAVGGSLVAQWELFDLMEDTWPRLKKNLNELKRAVQKVDWTVSPFVATGAEEPSELAKAKADLLERALWGCRPDIASDENPFEDAIYDACDALGKGISVQEVLWEMRDGAILPRAWQWVHPRHYGYPHNSAALQLDPDGNGTSWLPFPPDKFVVATFKTKTGHLLTSAMLRSLATFWIGASFAYDWSLNLAQIFGIPFRWANYDPQISPRALDDLCEMLANMGSAGWGAFPQGTTMEFKEAVANAANNPQARLMEIADLACDILILGQTLTTSAGDKGSQALGTVHSDVRADVIEYSGEWAAKTFQYQFVVPLMRMNFGDNEEDPMLVAEIAQTKDAQGMAERDKVLIVDMGMAVSKAWLYERHEVPIPEGEDVFDAPKPPPPVPPPGALPPGGTPPDPNADPAKPADPNAPADPAKPGEETKAKAALVQAANAATAKLADNVLENLSGVEARWLGGVKPVFVDLLNAARDNTLSDELFIQALESARDQMPELFSQLDTDAVIDALEASMGAAAVNGAVSAYMRLHRTARQHKARKEATLENV